MGLARRFTDWLRQHPLVADTALMALVLGIGILGLLGFRAFQLSFDRAQASIAAASLGLVLTLAILDESRQALSAERSGAVSDVALDLSGAVGMLGLAAVIRRKRAPAAG